MRKKLEWTSDDLTTEQAKMWQPEHQSQDADDDRSTIKDQAVVQMVLRNSYGSSFIGSFLAKRELVPGQIHRSCQHSEIDASDREPAPIIVGCEVDG